jgi:twitching motility protein PilT
MQSPSRQLGEFLIERKVLDRDSLESVLQRESDTGVPLAKILTGEGLVSERDLVAAIAAQLGYPFWESESQPVQPGLERMLPADVARRRCAVVLTVDRDRMMVAVEDPDDTAALEEIAAASGMSVTPVVGVRADLLNALSKLYPESPEEAAQASTGSSPAVVGPGHELHVNDLLAKVAELGASDLHLTVGIQPSVRVDGEIQALEEFPVLNGSEIRRMIYSILSAKQREKFEGELELDTSYSIPHMGRFRVNVFLQRDCVGAVMRAIPYEIVPLENLGLPLSISSLAALPRGLVLVTGPTGSGKSTTLASLVDVVNVDRACHIMTVEDPIEFLHKHKRSIINQREVGEDTKSFAQALKHVLRQDPDVILVGEMRDLETISTALTAAETGHLVFGTLHTQDAPQSIDRIIDVFPAHQQQQIRVQLASALQGVVSQQLLPRLSGRGRMVACEVLIATPAVRNLIREGKTHQIYSTMQAGGRYGMQTMDQSLANLVRAGQVGLDIAVERCANEDDLRRLAGGK